jgi:hypothetical protein
MIGFKQGFDLPSDAQPDEPRRKDKEAGQKRKKRKHHRQGCIDGTPLFRLVLKEPDSKAHRFLLAVTSTLFGLAICLTESYFLNAKDAVQLTLMWAVPSTICLVIYYPLYVAESMSDDDKEADGVDGNGKGQKDIEHTFFNFVKRLTTVVVIILYGYVLCQTILYFVDQKTASGLAVLWSIPLVLSVVMLFLFD